LWLFIFHYHFQTGTVTVPDFSNPSQKLSRTEQKSVKTDETQKGKVAVDEAHRPTANGEWKWTTRSQSTSFPSNCEIRMRAKPHAGCWTLMPRSSEIWSTNCQLVVHSWQLATKLTCSASAKASTSRHKQPVAFRVRATGMVGDFRPRNQEQATVGRNVQKNVGAEIRK